MICISNFKFWPSPEPLQQPRLQQKWSSDWQILQHTGLCYICHWTKIKIISVSIQMCLSPGAVAVLLLSTSQVSAFLILITTDSGIVIEVNRSRSTSSHGGLVVDNRQFAKVGSRTKLHITSWAARSTTSSQTFLFTL